MRSSTKADPLRASTEARIAQIDQMTLQELTAFTSRMLDEILTRKVTPKDARIMDRAVGKRLKVIERDIRVGRITL